MEIYMNQFKYWQNLLFMAGNSSFTVWGWLVSKCKYCFRNFIDNSSGHCLDRTKLLQCELIKNCLSNCNVDSKQSRLVWHFVNGVPIGWQLWLESIINALAGRKARTLYGVNTGQLWIAKIKPLNTFGLCSAYQGLTLAGWGRVEKLTELYSTWQWE